MTIVCYDGKTIAADKMSRVKGKDGKRRVHSLEKQKISRGFQGRLFKGERILLIGRAGLSKLSTATIEHLKKYKSTRTLKHNLQKTFPTGVGTGARLLIVTPKSVYRVRITKDFELIPSRAYPRTKKIALGSASRSAELLMRGLGMDAKHAVEFISLYTPGCGGGVDYTTRLLASFDTIHHLPPKDDRKQALLKVLQHLQDRIETRIQRLT